VWNYEAVRKAKFNFNSWSMSTAPQTAAQEILLFSPKTPFMDANFNTRLLGPNIGINEDPPVGSAIPAFASYLCSFDFTQQGTHTFAVDRGDDKNRRSVINIEMDNKSQAELALRIGGEAVMVAQGQMHLPG
jgi:trans-2,3-dihydro-3-hydroxyanthranilate isomerase